MSSDEYTTDEGKRRKNWEDEEDVEDETRNKTKKIARSPGKSKSKTEGEKLEKILEMMKHLTDEVKGIRAEQKDYRNEIRKLRKENEQTKHENAKLKEEVKTINARLDAMEREKRRNNIVVQGLMLEDDGMLTPKEPMENFMKKQLEIDVGVKSAVKLGRKTYLVELDNANEKMKVMKNKNKLRNYKEGKVYINDDMSKKEREIQGKIRKAAQEEKKKGKKTKIGYQKVFVDDQEWKWCEDEERLVLIKKAEDNTSKND